MLPRTKSGVRNVEGPSAIKYQQGTATRQATDEAKRRKNVHHMQEIELASSQRAGRNFTAANWREHNCDLAFETFWRDRLFD